ncbi:hypothetical protein FDV_s9gp2 [Fiji disease virus]|uniref:Uncharacterized protein VP9-2 n=1 Tax=Fiji disease virus (isolate Sugarcane) TaxID=648172 RepID=VP92_FDVS|nr:hypothetical protein FDV_s9gp2 [Fiji disease virus]Q9YX37.1 RecName: Full=Uncharacterized protein VP9-2 [Fiji disease virus isolate Sugarcane]AAD04816.1 unknown [Fiji disease virus]
MDTSHKVYNFECPFELAKVEMKAISNTMHKVDDFVSTIDVNFSDSELDDKVDDLEIKIEKVSGPLLNRYLGSVGKVVFLIFSFLFFGSIKLVLKCFYHLFKCVFCNPLTRCFCSIIFTIIFYTLLFVSCYLLWHYFGDVIIQTIKDINNNRSVNFTNETENFNSKVETTTMKIIQLIFSKSDNNGVEHIIKSANVTSGQTANFTLLNG